MNAIENILSRNSISKLGEPYPTSEQMDLVYRAALRAPDHAWLRPSEFIEITGNGLDRLSSIFEKYAIENIEDVNEQKIIKYKNAPYRAPMVIVLISNIKKNNRVPEIEQILSTGAAAQNMLLTLHALNYGAIWRTGVFALNDEIGKYFNLNKNQKILGYLYVGKPTMKPKKIPEIDVEEHVSRWK
tara:strand:- start:7903 stop:8460 length:558 start_codon:yes stop_codon:yes gene_type:complete